MRAVTTHGLRQQFLQSLRRCKVKLLMDMRPYPAKGGGALWRWQTGCASFFNPRMNGAQQRKEVSQADGLP